jgi:hypothetical protein
MLWLFTASHHPSQDGDDDRSVEHWYAALGCQSDLTQLQLTVTPVTERSRSIDYNPLPRGH